MRCEVMEDNGSMRHEVIALHLIDPLFHTSHRPPPLSSITSYLTDPLFCWFFFVK